QQAAHKARPFISKTFEPRLNRNRNASFLQQFVFHYAEPGGAAMPPGGRSKASACPSITVLDRQQRVARRAVDIEEGAVADAVQIAAVEQIVDDQQGLPIVIGLIAQFGRYRRVSALIYVGGEKIALRLHARPHGPAL